MASLSLRARCALINKRYKSKIQRSVKIDRLRKFYLHNKVAFKKLGVQYYGEEKDPETLLQKR